MTRAKRVRQRRRIFASSRDGTPLVPGAAQRQRHCCCGAPDHAERPHDKPLAHGKLSYRTAFSVQTNSCWRKASRRTQWTRNVSTSEGEPGWNLSAPTRWIQETRRSTPVTTSSSSDEEAGEEADEDPGCLRDSRPCAAAVLRRLPQHTAMRPLACLNHVLAPLLRFVLRPLGGFLRTGGAELGRGCDAGRVRRSTTTTTQSCSTTPCRSRQTSKAGVAHADATARVAHADATFTLVFAGADGRRLRRGSALAPRRGA